MNILFLTIGELESIETHSLYSDLLRCIRNHGHTVYSVSAYERRVGKETKYRLENGYNALKVKVGNLTKCGIIEKGISTLLIEFQYKAAIKTYLSDVKFDLVIYSTPPITLGSVVQYIKNRDNAKTYLLLKDIFPQNAVDLGMMKTHGIMGVMYKYFKEKEKNLYAISDRIGCMSQANVDFILRESGVNKEKVEICPNTVDVIETVKVENREKLLKKYDIPRDKYLLLYGGNFGKPQNVPYIVEVLRKASVISNIHFVLCGSGTEYSVFKKYYEESKPSHITLLEHLPYKEYADLVSVCNVGLLFLDYRFTIPNYPSRLLDYMNYSLPVIAATDVNTDVGKDIVEGNFGWWVESRDSEEYIKLLKTIFESCNVEKNILEKSKNSKKYLIENFETSRAYDMIVGSYNKNFTS